MENGTLQEVSNDVSALPYADLRAAGTHVARKLDHANYSQFGVPPEGDVPPDFLRQNAPEMSGFLFCRADFLPALWQRNVRFDLHAPGGGIYREQISILSPAPAAGHALEPDLA